MDRAALAAFIATDLDISLAEAGIATTDTPDGLAPILDRVAMLTPADLDVEWLRKLGRYAALDRIVSRLVMNMSISISGNSYNLQQQFLNVKALRDEAYKQVAWIVDPVVPGTESGSGGALTIDMPYLTEGECSW
jgi:hypothetical protein